MYWTTFPNYCRSLQLIRETGIGRIYRYCQSLKLLFKEGLAKQVLGKIRVLLPVLTSPHIFGMQIRHAITGQDLTKDLYDYLKKSAVDVSLRQAFFFP